MLALDCGHARLARLFVRQSNVNREVPHRISQPAESLPPKKVRILCAAIHLRPNGQVSDGQKAWRQSLLTQSSGAKGRNF
jgi:hypothetical protein